MTWSYAAAFEPELREERWTDVFCQPNAEPEPFGIVFIEALDAGLPVVTTDMGGGREIVTAECGILVPPADPAALSGVLAGLKGDRERRARLGRRGPVRARALCDPANQLRKLSDALSSPGRTRSVVP